MKRCWVLSLALLIIFPAAALSAEEVIEDVQVAIVGTNGNDVIENTTPGTASADIDTDSDDNVLTSATGIDALRGDDRIGNTSSLTAEGESRVDIPMKYSTTQAEARSTGITGGAGHDDITNSGAITTSSIVNSIIGNFLMMVADIGVTGWPTTSTADSTGIDGGTGLDTVTSSGSIYVFAQADSTVSQGTVSVLEVPVDAFSLGDARTEAISTAAGIRGGDSYVTGGQPESLANSGVMTIHSKATATADKFVLEAIGAARIDGSTTADARAAGIEGGTRSNTITNGNSISVTAEAEARFAATQLKMKGLMLKSLLKLFGLDVGKISTTATAEAVGIDGGSGDDTITNAETAQMIDVYGKATAHSQEVTLAISPPTGGGEASAASAPEAGVSVADVSAPAAASADGSAAGEAYGDADTVSVATATGISGGSGRDTITSDAPLTAGTESFASSTGVNAAVTLSDESYLPVPGAAVADTKTASYAASTAIDGGSGNDTITNSAALDAISYAEGAATTVGAVIKGSLKGLNMGVTVVDSSSRATAVSTGIAGGSGDDGITNIGFITSRATSRDDADTVAVTAAGGKVGMAFGVALADASSTASASSYGIDASGEDAGESRETVMNYGTIDVDATSTASVMSVGVTFSAELEGVVGGVSAAKGDGTAESFATGVRTGGGNDVIVNEYEGSLSADAVATSSSDVVAVTVSAAWKGVALGASFADANTVATTTSTGIYSGAGDDTITSSKEVTSTATSNVVSDVISVDVAVAIKGFSAGIAISNTETNSKATAVGISAGEGSDSVTTGALVDVDAKATTEINAITINFAMAGAAIADATSEAEAVATGLDGGGGVDSLTNEGAIDVTATAIADDTSATANFAGYAEGDVTTTATATATGIQGGAAVDGTPIGDRIENDHDGSITVLSSAQIDAENYVVQGGGAAIADTGGKGFSYATGIAGDICADTILNHGAVDVTAETDLVAIGFNFQLFGVQLGSAGLNAEGTATGIYGGAGSNVVINSTTGAIDVFADVETLAGSVIAGFSAGVVSAGTTADVISRGILTGDDVDNIENYGSIAVSESALGQAGAGSIGLMALSLANSLAYGTVEGINAGAGDDVVINGTSGVLTVGTVADGHDALVKADTEAIAFDFFSLVISTLGANAEVAGIVGAAGDDTITNSGRIIVGDHDNWMVVGESLGAAGQIAGAESVYAGTTVNATASGIDGGGDDDTIINNAEGAIQVDARGYADVDSQGYVLFGTFLPLTAKSSANGDVSATGIQCASGNDFVDNRGTVASSAYMLSDAWSSADLPSGIASSPFADSTGKAEAYSVGVDLGSGVGRLLNSGFVDAQATALTRSYAFSDSDFLRTYGDAYARSIADAAGVAGGNDGNIVLNAETGTIAAAATARTDDTQGNITRVKSDEEATAVGGEWDGRAQKWLPVSANAEGVSLGSGDDVVVNDGSIMSSSLSDTRTYAHTSSWVRNTESEARSVAAATAKGIAAGTGLNTVTNNGQVTVSAVGNAHPDTDSWSRDYRAKTHSIADASATATGIEADGNLTNSSDGDLSVTARATTKAYSNTEAETTLATAQMKAEATGIGTPQPAAGGGQAGNVPDLILNDGSIVVSALAGEDADGNRKEMAYADTDTWVRSCRAEASGTATSDAAGIRVDDEGKTIVNNGTIQVLGRTRAYVRAYADSRDYRPTGNAYAAGTATATGISAAGGDNRIYNGGTLDVTASVLDTYSRGDTWSSWSSCRSSAETHATAAATGIGAGAGDDRIDNDGQITVTASANAKSYAWADTRDNNLASEYETTTAAAQALATGIDADEGINTVYNTGTLNVTADATAFPSAGGGHASVTMSLNTDATAVGITAGDDGNTIVNTGSIDVSATAGMFSINDASAVGILTGAGDDKIINEGTIVTDVFNYVLIPIFGEHRPGFAIDSGEGDDTVTLLGESQATGFIDLGPGDDILQFYGDALLTGGADGGAGTDMLILDGQGSAAGTLWGFETALKLGPGTFTVDAFPQSDRLAANEGVLYVTQAGAMYSGGVFAPAVYSGGVCGSVEVDGGATLAGGLEVVKGPGACLDGDTFVILTAESITGEFDSTVLPEPTALRSFELNRLEDSLQVVAGVEDCITEARTPQQAALARRIDSLLPSASGDLSVLFGEFQSLGKSEFGQAFYAVSPESYNNATGATVSVARQVGGAFQQRLGNVRAAIIAERDNEREEELAAMLATTGSLAVLGTVPTIKERRAETPYGVWLGGFGQRADQSSSASLTGYDVKTGGVIGGFDHTFSENVIAGGGIQYSNSSIDFDNHAGDSTVENIGGSLYGTYFTRQSYFDAALSYSYQQYDNDRNVDVGGIERKARSEHDGDAFSVSVGGGHHFTAGEWKIGPFGLLQYVYLHESGFTESGAGAANLTVGGRDTDSLVSQLGLRFTRVFTVKDTTIVPELSVGWLYDFDIDDRTITAAFDGTPGSSFSIRGQEVEKHGVTVRLAATVFDNKGFSLAVKYFGEFRDDYDAHGAAAEARFDF